MTQEHTKGPWIIQDNETGKFLAAQTGWSASFDRDDASEAEEESGEYMGVSSSTPVMTEDKSKTVAVVCGFGFASECDYLEANARLIAAAPDLLEALEKITRIEDDFSDNGHGSAKILMKEIAQKAIQKARGE
jgi:hypothetical protein